MTLALGSATASPAAASTTIGSTFAPTDMCQPVFTAIQTTSPPGTSYAVATAGVITSWQVRTAPPPALPPQVKFKVFRPAGANDYTVIGESLTLITGANSTITRTIRISVRAGDLIGVTVLTAGTCRVLAPGSNHFVNGDAALGSTMTYASGSGIFPVAAVLEADADGDGFGDESQDACPTQASAGAACDVTAPDTRIVAGQRASFNGKAKYVFTATDAAAKFDCRLKGATKKLDGFRPCTSPAKYKHLNPGKYKFFVRSVDEFGNTDASPAKRKLTVRPRT